MGACTAAWILIGFSTAGQGTAFSATPEARGVAFLCREVPRWSRENHCYSCHNNGDAARALYQASRLGIPGAGDALADTTRWLLRPAGWDHNGGDGPSSDRKLARIAFTAALETAVATGAVKDRKPLLEAANRLVDDQDWRGAWTVEGEDSGGAPANYGRTLATYLARRSLSAADPERFRGAIDRADRWLAGRAIQTTTEAAVGLLCAAGPTGRAADQKPEILRLLRRAQSDDGGWGPQAAAPPEAFDTALVVLALAQSGDSPEVRAMLKRGRGFLIAEQHEDGSWTETTRPSGNVSYAERISTTGWAVMALLETRDAARSSRSDAKR